MTIVCFCSFYTGTVSGRTVARTSMTRIQPTPTRSFAKPRAPGDPFNRYTVRFTPSHTFNRSEKKGANLKHRVTLRSGGQCQIPDDFVVARGSSITKAFMMSTSTSLTYSEAASLCSGNGIRLATIRSKEDFQFMVDNCE